MVSTARATAPRRAWTWRGARAVIASACSWAPAGPSRTRYSPRIASSRASRFRAPAWPSAAAAFHRAASPSSTPTPVQSRTSCPTAACPTRAMTAAPAATAAMTTTASPAPTASTSPSTTWCSRRPSARVCSASSALTSPTTCSGTSRRWATAASRPTRPAPSRCSSAPMAPPAIRWPTTSPCPRSIRTTRSASTWSRVTT